MTLEARIIDQVRVLLARGCTNRQVARLMSGQVGHSKVSQLRREISPLNYPTLPLPDDPDTAPIVAKCPGCHYTVELPCRICQARDYRHRRLQYQREHRRRREARQS
jgi:hypothetical protein